MLHIYIYIYIYDISSLRIKINFLIRVLSSQLGPGVPSTPLDSPTEICVLFLTSVLCYMPHLPIQCQQYHEAPLCDIGVILQLVSLSLS